MSTADSSDLDPRQIRVGDAERTAALDALGEHMASGRIDLDEYGTRSAQVTQARTVADLQALFRDLPAPHPSLPGAAPLPAVPQSAAPVPPAAPGSSALARPDDRTPAQRIAAVATGLSGIVGLILFLITGQWWFFLLPAVVGIVTSQLGGKGWNR